MDAPATPAQGDARLSDHRLDDILKFPVEGHDWTADIATPWVKIGQHDLKELVRGYRATTPTVEEGTKP